MVGGTFARIQFTPDLLPADVMGTRIFRASTETFDVELGPVFANVVLADDDLLHLVEERVEAAPQLAHGLVDLVRVKGHEPGPRF